MASLPDWVLEQYPHAADLEDDLSDTEFEDVMPASSTASLASVRRRCVVVTGLPVVAENRVGKLQGVLQKIFDANSAVAREIRFPCEGGSTKGLAFVEFATVDGATFARRHLHTLFKKVDPRVSLGTYSFDDFKYVAGASESYENLMEKNQPAYDADKWLLDRKGRDQFVIRYKLSEDAASALKHKTAVYWWSDPGHSESNFIYGGQREEEEGSNWTKDLVQWSPQGRFLVTFAQQGVVLWAGPRFVKWGRFPHSSAKKAVFSNCERYLVTYSETGGIVWDVRTQTEVLLLPKRSAVASTECDIGFSPDGNYVSQPDVANGKIYVYDLTGLDMSAEENKPAGKDAVGPLPGIADSAVVNFCPVRYESVSIKIRCNLLGDAPIDAPGLESMSWAPAGKNVLVWTSPEVDATPARITFVSVPSKEAVKTKAFFNVIETSLTWHPDGTYVALQCVMPSPQLARRIRQKKATPEDYAGNTTTTVDVFRMEERDFPVDMITLKNRVVHFSWEPKGSRFAIIHQTPTATVSFFDLSKGKVRESARASSGAGAVTPAPTPAPAAVTGGAGGPAGAPAAPTGPDVEIISERLSEPFRIVKAVNRVVWSPFGRFCVMAQYDGNSLFFMDVNESKILAQGDHHTVNHVEFDPSGRYVVSVKKQDLNTQIAKQQVENGFMVWSFQGHRLFADKKDHLYQFLWRPRPMLVEFSATAFADVSRAEYLKEKSREKLKAYLARKRLFLEYAELERQCADVWASQKPARAALGIIDDADAGILATVDVDVVLAEKVEPV